MKMFNGWLKANRRHTTVMDATNYLELACHPEKLSEHVLRLIGDAEVYLGVVAEGVPQDLSTDEERRAAWEKGREEFIGTLVLALGSIASTLNAVGCTDTELTQLCLASLTKTAGGGGAVPVVPEGVQET